MGVTLDKEEVVRVHLSGELFADCVSVDVCRWNGWVTPTFTTEQREFVLSECVRLGWNESGELVEGVSWEFEGWRDLGSGEWLCEGWCWEEVE